MPSDHQLSKSTMAGAKHMGQHRRVSIKVCRQPNTRLGSSKGIGTPHERQRPSRGQSQRLRCSCCLQDLPSQVDGNLSDNTCWRCGYMTCTSCRSNLSPSAHRWVCTTCSKKISFTWLFQKTVHGANLLLRVLEFCEPRVQPLLKCVFATEDTQKTSQCEKTPTNGRGAVSQVTSCQKPKHVAVTAKGEEAEEDAKLLVKGATQRRSAAKGTPRKGKISSKYVTKAQSLEMQVRSPPPSPSRTPFKFLSNSPAGNKTPLKRIEKNTNLSSNGASPTAKPGITHTTIPSDGATSTVGKNVGAGTMVGVSGSRGDGHRQDELGTEVKNGNQFLRCDGMHPDSKCLVFSYSNDTHASSQLSFAISGADSPPPRFPNFSKFLDDQEGLRREFDEPQNRRLQHLFAEKDEPQKNYSDLVTVETSEGVSPLKVVECAEADNNFPIPPKLALNFCKLGLVSNHVTDAEQEPSAVHSSNNKLICKPTARVSINAESATQRGPQKNSCGSGGPHGSEHACTSRLVRSNTINGDCIDAVFKRIQPCLTTVVHDSNGAYTGGPQNGNTADAGTGTVTKLGASNKTHPRAPTIKPPSKTRTTSSSRTFKTPRALFSDSRLCGKDADSSSPRTRRGSARYLLAIEKDGVHSPRPAPVLAGVKPRGRTPLTARPPSSRCSGECGALARGSSILTRQGVSVPRQRTCEGQGSRHARVNTPLQRIHSSRLVPAEDSQGRYLPSHGNADAVKPRLSINSGQSVQLVPPAPLTVNPSRGRAVGTLNGKGATSTGGNSQTNLSRGGANGASTSRFIAQRTWNLL
ncbi:hypothetical protein, conserved [Trypanosoma brucei gambiense DAL972]|uniref:Uncharacterized protein n=1 Tax=Trypanosoma brucei gambiense (strain MHOM/CI/86/DAL972) TaxID=679716 RepID=C9ZPP2_TRYB9|nr:hypothetical protein, conserved [Trypanosoma brucei gambiense DAL972]CBH11370.1 hypothetical protein, conserved [Trypanosoma brucei gambiense DAL972]|eukprot:XP_011773657.1 hypothetical protein, conserved [Trypanosoma brucei gambiense DAL972]